MIARLPVSAITVSAITVSATGGRVVIFDHTGHKIWSYRGAGHDTLNHPSLALPLPNDDVVLNDDYNHRVTIK